MKKSLLLIFLLISFFQTRLSAQTEFELRWQAKRLSKSCFTVTRDENDKAGAIWWPNKVDLTKRLELNFVVYMGNKNDGGADGLAFIFHNDPRGHEAHGEEGGGLYYGDHPSKPSADQGYGRAVDKKITPSIAIEMDTYRNNSCVPDTAIDHTSIVYNGETCNPQIITSVGKKFLQLHPTKTDVEDNTCFNARIVWEPSTKELSLYFSNKEDPVVHRFTHQVNLVNDIFNGQTQVYYGFTGSTGGLSNDQTICIFEGNDIPFAQNDLAKTPYGTPVVVDVQKNDGDTDGDPIFTNAIIVPPIHGTATILNRDSIRYSPYTGYAGLDSLQYEIVDIDPALASPDKCYVNRTRAWVFFNRVECPTYTLKAEKIKDNEKCDPTKPNNGRGQAYMLNGATKITTGFTFNWYKGTFTAAELVGKTPDYTGVDITNLVDSEYTIAVKLTLTSNCSFNLDYIKIERDETKPDFEIKLGQAATTCVPSNGSIYVEFADPSTDKTKYTYRWYEVLPTIIGTNFELNNLQPKNYTVTVTNNLSGCEDVKSFTVPYNFVSPPVTVDVKDRVSCNSPDGSLSAKVNNLTSGYEVKWAKANDRKFLNPYIGWTYNNLDTGTYYVTAKDLATGCPLKDTLTVKVLDKRPIPKLITYNSIAQTSCDIARPNGSIDITEVQINGNWTPLGNYNYNFFVGDNLVTPIPSTSQEAHGAKYLPSGLYTLLIVNKVTGCSTRDTIRVLDEKDELMVVQDALTPQTNCEPANGAIKVSVEPNKTKPKGKTTVGYTFEWWEGKTVTTSDPKYTGFEITGLKAGFYTVRVSSLNGCEGIKVFEVVDQTVPPVITFGTPVNDNSCDANKPNGSVTAVITGIPVGANLKYEWFRGNNTTNLISTTTSTTPTATRTGLATNNYTLRVTNIATGCFATKFVFVGKDVFPTFTVTPSKIDVSCNNNTGGSNGSVSAIASIADPIVYRWYAGKQVKATPDFTGQTWTNRKAGFYTVVAFHPGTNCRADVEKTIEVEEQLLLTVSISDPGNFNGCVDPSAELTATPSGGNGGPYDYFWYVGDPDLATYPYYSSNRIIGTSAVLGNISPNKYRVRVVDKSTSPNCVAFAERDLTSSYEVPAIKIKTVNNNISCNPAYNGRIEIEYIIPNPVTAPAVRIYPDAVGVFPNHINIYWINGATDPSPTLPASTQNGIYPNLGSGNFGIILSVTGNPCISAFNPVTIKDEFDDPILSHTKADLTHCAQPNGVITININNYSGNPGDYTTAITKDGTAFSTNIPPLANPWVLTNLPLGAYSISLIKSTCPTVILDTIKDASVTPVGTVAIADNFNCINPNGSVTVNSPDPDHLFHWYDANGVEIGDPLGTQLSIDPKIHGKYKLQIVDKNTSCPSDIIDAEILDKREYPTIEILSKTPRTVCSNNFDGTVSIEFGPKANYGDYNVSWTLNSAPVTPFITNTGPTTFTASTLDTGKYVLTFADKITGCDIKASFRIELDQNRPELKLTATDKGSCLPLDGSLTATLVTGTGTVAVAPVKWAKLENGVQTLIPSFDNILHHPGVNSGEYLVWAESDGKGCPSPLVQVTVNDKTPKIQINLVELNHQSRCDSLVTQNGMIRISVTPSVGSYSYQWFKNGNSIQNATTPSVSGLSRGRYVIEVTNNGCVFRDTFNIRNERKKFIPVIAKQNVTRCEAPYDGLLAASVNGATNGYSFNWTNLESSASYPSAEAQQLPAGNYRLHVINEETTCDTTLFVTLDFVDQPFDIIAIEDSPVTNCDMTKANGQMTIRVNGQVEGYNFDWYETAHITAASPVVFNGSTINELKPVAYTIRVTNMLTACKKDLTVTPLFLPVQVPLPTLVISGGVSSCVKDNGFAEVKVGESNSNHIFNWYIGNQVKATPDYTGYYVENLSIGEYLVIATDRISGCLSQPLKVTIGDEKIFVDIKAATKNSLCHSNNGGATITWIEPVGVTRIELTNGIETLNGDIFSDLAYGEFHITVETVEGCVSEKNIKIGADWLVFNGVSPNGDGLNDILAIDCIELFPNNKVKIFNRAGTLVYVGEGYNNDSNYFNGFGNRGVYTTGNFLPDGTYYYVVDPGNGDKATAGFFELLR